MKFIRYLFTALAAASFALPSLAAEELTREKRADIERLLEMTGALSLSKQMAAMAAGQMAQLLKKSRPDIPQKALDALPEEIGFVFEANMGSFKEVVIPVYHKYFTADEMKEMIRFYSTPLGQKTVKVLPSLMSETMVAGQKWGEGLGPEIGQRIKARMKKEGVDL
jgi:uncharacterized protein